MTDLTDTTDGIVGRQTTAHLVAEARTLIADCSTYNFGMRNADRLAHAVAPALVRRVEELEAILGAVDAEVSAPTRFKAPITFGAAAAIVRFKLRLQQIIRNTTPNGAAE